MNKKIVSLVLAMCLSVGLGVSSLFASPSLRDADITLGYEAANAGTYTYDVKDASGTVTGTVTKEGFQIKAGSAEDKLSGCLVGVFSYYAGIMTGYDQAGGTYTIYDSYGARATLQATDNGTFTLTGFNFRTSDLANMPGENATVEQWNTYLKGLGFNDATLSRMVFNKDGTPKGLNSDGTGEVETQSMNLALFQCLRDNLASGLNHGASLNMGDGATGMTLTVTEDGKTFYTLASYDAIDSNDKTGTVKMNGKTYSGIRTVSSVTYDDYGYQIGSKTYGFEFDNADANSGNSRLGVGGKWVVNETKIHYDENNIRYDVTYKTDLAGNNLNGDVETSHYTDNAKALGISASAIAGIGGAISVVTYTANGSRNVSIDGTTGNISYFADNQISVVKNSDKGVVANYFRAENGVLISKWESDGTADADDAGTRGGTTTVYSYYGETPMYAFNDVSGEKYFGSSAKAQEAIKKGDKIKAQIMAGKYPNLSSSDIKTIYWTQKDIVKMQKSGCTFFSKSEMANMLKGSNGTGVVGKTDISASTWDQLPENAIMAGKVTTSSRPGGEAKGTVLEKEYKGYTVKNTIMMGGSAVYTTQHNIVTSGNVLISSDPAVSGKLYPGEGATDEEIEAKAKELLGDDYDNLTDEEKEAVLNELKEGFITIEGKTYAVVIDAEMNVLDGSGFHSANGEAILVEVTDEQKERIKSNVSESRDVMFMGNVSPTVNGHLAIAMEDSYGGGFVSGTAEEINEIKNEMDAVINAVKDFKDGLIDEKTYKEIISRAEGDNAGKYEWLVDNTTENLAKFKGNFAWDPTNQDNKQQLIEALKWLF